MRKTKKFPKYLFVARDGEGEDEFFNTQESGRDCINDDGPTRVATYQLVEVKELSKITEGKVVKN